MEEEKSLPVPTPIKEIIEDENSFKTYIDFKVVDGNKLFEKLYLLQNL